MSRPPLLDPITSAFDAAGWSFHRVPGHDVLEAGFEAHHSKVHLHVQAFEQIDAVSVVATASVTIPSSHRQSAAELLMRTNEQLTVGNFELRWDAGQVLFRTTNIFPKEGEPDQNIVTGMVQNAIAETDRITPYLSTLVGEPSGKPNIRDLLARSDLAWEAAP